MRPISSLPICNYDFQTQEVPFLSWAHFCQRHFDLQKLNWSVKSEGLSLALWNTSWDTRIHICCIFFGWNRMDLNGKILLLNTLSENVYVVQCTSTFWRNSLTSLSVSLKSLVLLFEKDQQFCEVLQNGGAVCALSLLLGLETILHLLDCNWDSTICIFLGQAWINIAAFYQVEKNSGYSPLASR